MNNIWDFKVVITSFSLYRNKIMIYIIWFLASPKERELNILVPLSGLMLKRIQEKEKEIHQQQ